MPSEAPLSTTGYGKTSTNNNNKQTHYMTDTHPDVSHTFTTDQGLRLTLPHFFIFFDLDLDLGAGVTFSRLKGFLEEVHAPYLFLLLDFGFCFLTLEFDYSMQPWTTEEKKRNWMIEHLQNDSLCDARN